MRLRIKFYATTAFMILSLWLDIAWAACSVSVTSAVSFGNYDFTSPLPNDLGVGNVRVTCSGVIGLFINYDISLSSGNSGSYNPRSMPAPLPSPDTLQYNLFTGLLRTTVWGDGTGGTAIVQGSILIELLFPVSVDHPVYGRIFQGQSVPAGSYTDSILVTVSY